MKKIMLMCFIVIFFITGCDKEKDTHTIITNNYNAILYPPLIPNKKPTMKQKIKANFLADNKIMNTIIESNSDGLIEKVLFDDDSQNMIIDYKNKTMHLNGVDVTLQLDSDNNILGYLYINNEQLASLSYNELGQFIKLEDMHPLTKEKRQQTFGYYNGNTIKYNEFRKKNINLNRFYYNQKGELVESITENYIITDDNSKTDNSPKPDINVKQSDRKPENLKPNAVKCIYLNHNQYGDWTNAYCVKGNGVKLVTHTRELEY
ncbi:hypothetical protein [uncultured Gilliamella sp.]|uniref:hypothetical protein n=1 Tax=uncultured Gilliamella sp. TaxID=1193505 RepID=UPI0025FD630D|nr:hypothetical protein [uncultured Gilliamella sp.]